MSEKQIRQLIMLGIAGAAIYYIFFKSSSTAAFPASVTVTPENPDLLPQPQAVTPQAGWLTQGSGAMGPIAISPTGGGGW